MTTGHAHYSGGAMLARRGSWLAPYRPYTRVGGAAITHAHYAARAPWRGPVAYAPLVVGRATGGRAFRRATGGRGRPPAAGDACRLIG